VHRHDLSSDAAGFLSMLNDFQVSPDGKTIYIAEASPILNTPAILVHDVESATTRRLLDGHPSVQSRPYLLQAPGRDMVVYGIYDLRVPVDSIGLDRKGEWLYYGPLSGDRLYRISTHDLADASLDADALGARVEDYGPKTITDGITTDNAGNVYLSDPEHSAILLLGPDRKLRTLVKDERLRWPDGFSFGPDGWLYVTASSLHHVLFVSEEHRDAHAPYHIFRVKPGGEGVPGH
jgi:sugar lactone lactonase YvrE